MFSLHARHLGDLAWQEMCKASVSTIIGAEVERKQWVKDVARDFGEILEKPDLCEKTEEWTTHNDEVFMPAATTVVEYGVIFGLYKLRGNPPALAGFLQPSRKDAQHRGSYSRMHATLRRALDQAVEQERVRG